MTQETRRVGRFLEANFSLEGRTALVTGGGRGLGRAMALALASAGADIAVVARTPEELAETKAQIEALGRRAAAIQGDIGTAEGAIGATARAAGELGKIDILVNNAGMIRRKPILEFTLRDWDETMNVNLRGAFLCAQSAAQGMVARRWGRIINVGSLAAVCARPNAGLYGISKSGLLQMTRSLAIELVHHGVTVNALAPGFFHTDFMEPVLQNRTASEALLSRIPKGRFGLPNDLLGAVILFASNASDYITGQVLFVDGGWTGA